MIEYFNLKSSFYDCCIERYIGCITAEACRQLHVMRHSVQWTPVVAKQSITIYQSIAAAFFKISYLKHNWRCKLGMHELSSAERNARYRRFFELLNNPPGLCQVILNLLSVSYRKICGVMRQLHNRKVTEKRLLIIVNCFILKISIFNKRNNCTFICLMLLCYLHFIAQLI
jgi:hypothetical protein